MPLVLPLVNDPVEFSLFSLAPLLVWLYLSFFVIFIFAPCVYLCFALTFVFPLFSPAALYIHLHFCENARLFAVHL